MSIINQIKKNKDYFEAINVIIKHDKNIEIGNYLTETIYIDDDLEGISIGFDDDGIYIVSSDFYKMTIHFKGQKAYFPVGAKVKVTDDEEFLRSELEKGGFSDYINEEDKQAYIKGLAAGEFLITNIFDGTYRVEREEFEKVKEGEIKPLFTYLPHSVLTLV